ncbi:uncharacterized protein LOC106639112 [Copidosoma floridanum]|uniref:uncharacterized protein LOC106639112 n=1 Tax=Copidosoma floridanum TaxID=29053 RepID=UPI0006C97EB4|nr:uncharacterized protein LOC106639112 [Copidosoma floridanum]
MWGEKTFFKLLFLSLVFSITNAQIETLLEGFGYLYSAYDFLSKKFENTELKPTAEDLHYQSLRNDIRDLKINLKEIEHHIPREVDMHRRLNSLRLTFSNIDRRYDEYIKYNQNISRYQPETILNYAEETKNLLDMLRQMHNDVIALDKNSLVALVEKYIDNLDPYCGRTETRQRYLYNFFRTYLSYETKGIVILKHAYKLKYQNITDAKNLQENKDWKKSVRRMIKNTMKTFKIMMSRAERELWKCDPKTPVENQTFVELKLFQRVLYKGWDFQNFGIFNPPRRDFCPEPLKNEGAEPICKLVTCSSKQRRCTNVVGCKALEFMKPISACILKDQSQRRRYSSVNETYKYLSKLSFVDQIFVPSYCNENSDRYLFKSSVNTMTPDVVSTLACDCFYRRFLIILNIDGDSVVTGVKFVLVNHTLHIQIQQGKLKPYGSIGNKSVKWKDIEPFSNYKLKIPTFSRNLNNVYDTSEFYDTINTVKLDWYEKRGLYLDDMDLNKNEVVVGVKFDLIYEKSDYIYVNLDIMAMEFNYTTGKLNPDKNYWWFSKKYSFNRTELKLEEYDTPTSFDDVENKPDGVPHKYVKFTPSAYSSKDAGQSTLPFIDIQPVVSDRPVPLSGISMDIKRADKSGGYLILKTKSYDVMWEFNNTTSEVEF